MADRQEALNNFLHAHQLPESFTGIAHTYYFPLAEWLVKTRSRAPLLVGINGCQGSGKSTLADFLAQVLRAEQGWNVAVLSIDDLYLTRTERAHLAATVHPLLATRGVPGTHDVELGNTVLDRLCVQTAGGSTALPRFDKSRDDRAPPETWPRAIGKVDMIILEGWCVGARPEHPAALANAVNALEENEDPDGTWRHYVNNSLKKYQHLFDRLHKMVLLKAPDFACVFHWRLEQERQLARHAPQGSALMNEADIARFIQHYQRLTEANLRTLPPTADVIFKLNTNHGIDSASYLLL